VAGRERRGLRRLACAWLGALIAASPLVARAQDAEPSEPEARVAASGPASELDAGALYRRLRGSFVVMRCVGERFGTGFGFGRIGRVATAAHVASCPRGLAAELAGGAVVPVRVVALHEELDLALLELTGAHAGEVQPLEPESEPLHVGGDVMSVGFPIGPETEESLELAITRGVLGQRSATRLVHDALISPGSSGGPLLDREGRVVGVSYAVPRDSAVALAVPVEHLVELDRSTAADASDPRSPFRLGFELGLSYEIADIHPFHFAGAQAELWLTVFDQLVASLRVVTLLRFPRTITDGGVLIEGNRFAGELDLGYRLRIDSFPVFFELAGGLSIANDHVVEIRQEVMLDDPSCDATMERCPIRIFGVQSARDEVLVRPLLTLRATLGPVTLAYTVLFDVERIEGTAHRITVRVGLF
jgi:hypothetical protein